MALFVLQPQQDHVLRAVQATRVQHMHMQPPPATALQNWPTEAEKSPSNALSLQEKFELAACELSPDYCLCILILKCSLLYQSSGMKLNLSHQCTQQPSCSLLSPSKLTCTCVSRHCTEMVAGLHSLGFTGEGICSFDAVRQWGVYRERKVENREAQENKKRLHICIVSDL